MLALLHTLTVLAAISSPAGSAEPADADERARVGVREYRFIDGEELTGEVLRPGGVQIHTRPARAHAGLITVRGQFLDQLARLAQDL